MRLAQFLTSRRLLGPQGVMDQILLCAVPRSPKPTKVSGKVWGSGSFGTVRNGFRHLGKAWGSLGQLRTVRNSLEFAPPKWPLSVSDRGIIGRSNSNLRQAAPSRSELIQAVPSCSTLLQTVPHCPKPPEVSGKFGTVWNSFELHGTVWSSAQQLWNLWNSHPR